MTRAAVWGLLALLVRTATTVEGVPDAVQAQFTCKGPTPYVQPVVNRVNVHGRRQYIAATGPSISAGAAGGYTLTVDGQVGATWPQVRISGIMGTNVSVVLSGPTSFVGAIFTSYQFSDRPFGNLFTSTGAATSYNCSTQTGTLKTVPVGTWTNTVGYMGAPISSLSATFLLANFAESTTIKWFVLPSAAHPLTWYGPFPQVVNAYTPPHSG